jgi:hypothetical protein
LGLQKQQLLDEALLQIHQIAVAYYQTQKAGEISY